MSEIKEFEEKMIKSVDALREEYVSIRAGRANPHVLDKIKVDYYGTPTALQQVANVSVPEARMIQIQPWESSLIKDIEKAIMISDLGITERLYVWYFLSLQRTDVKSLLRMLRKKVIMQRLQSAI